MGWETSKSARETKEGFPGEEASKTVGAVFYHSSHSGSKQSASRVNRCSVNGE